MNKSSFQNREILFIDNKEMDSSDLVKQANNHEQPLKREKFQPKEKRNQTTKTESSYWEKISLQVLRISLYL